MILSDGEIWEAIREGFIVFDPPLDADQVKASSVDLRLGYNVAVYPFDTSTLPKNVRDMITTVVDLQNEPDVVGFIDTMRRKNNTLLKDGQPVDLKPQSFLLAETLESFKLPNNIAGRVEGRSTYARLGIAVHQTAPSVKPGWEGQLTLEICNNGPFTYKLYPKMRLCQLILERVGQPVKKPDSSAWAKSKF